MRKTCLALWLMTGLVACSRSGSAVRDAGGGASGPADTGGMAGPGGPGGAGGTGSGSDSVAQAGTGGAGDPTGGGGNKTASVSGMGGGSAMNSAGRSADGGGITAGRGAAGAGGTCGVQVVHASRAAPDVLLVLDRSTSMVNDIAEDCNCTGTASSFPTCVATCKDRWSTLVSAISTTLSSTPNIHWGLKLFYTTSGGDSIDAGTTERNCRVGSQVEVPIGADSGPAILSTIQATTLEGYTPTRAAIMAATAYLRTVNDQNSKFILLATDGMPNCAAGNGGSTTNDTVGTLEVIKDAGFPVYVVGIGPESALQDLQALAVAGGTEHYYPATSPEELVAALSSITGAVATCTFNLSASPPYPDNVTVTLDQNVIPRDSAHGWSFASDTRTIELHGDSCKTLKASTTSTLTVQFNCSKATSQP